MPSDLQSPEKDFASHQEYLLLPSVAIIKKIEGNELYLFKDGKLIYKKWLGTGASKVFDVMAYDKYTLQSISDSTETLKIERMAMASEIVSILNEWAQIINAPGELPGDIIVLNFGIQAVCDGYEIYLNGFSWIDQASDIWLLAADYSPNINYVSLRKESLEIERLEMFTTYKDVIMQEIRSNSFRYPAQVKIITACFSDGQPEILVS